VNIARVIRIRVISHYQPEWDVNHRHLYAEFQSERRAQVFPQVPFIARRSANDVEALLLANQENRVVPLGEGNDPIRVRELREIRLLVAIWFENHATKSLAADEIR